MVILSTVLIALSGGRASAQEYCGPADVAFVVDDTFSTGPVLDSLRTRLLAVLNQIATSTDPGTGAGPDYRLALVTFKDGVTVRLNFGQNNAASQANADEFSRLIASLVPLAGGAGSGNASDEALKTVINGLASADRLPNLQTGDFSSPFRGPFNGLTTRKIVVLLTGFQPGGFDDDFRLEDQVNANQRAADAAAAGITIVAIFTPVVEAQQGAAPIMQHYAVTTGGTYIRTDEPPVEPGVAILNALASCPPVNKPPAANCGTAFETAAAPACAAVPATIDNSSWDPEGGLLARVQQPAGPYPVGVTDVTLTVTDDQGASATCSAPVTVSCDATPVVAVPPAIVEEATSADGRAVVFTATAADFAGNPITPVCAPGSGSSFPLGTTFVECTASDPYGNEGLASFSVTIVDTTPPAVTVPANQAIDITSGASAAVSFTASATDLVDGALTPVCTPASGFTFPLGATTVSCMATDSHANSSAPATFIVTITLVDTTAPIVTVPGSITAEASGAIGAAVSFAASAVDNLDGALTPTCVPAAGATFPPGPTTVTCTATDAHHNTGSGSFTVTVQDTRPPILTLPLPVTFETQDPTGAVVTYATPKAADVVDPAPTVTCAPASGSRFTVGTTPVNCIARDASGNEASGAFTVSVNLTMPPAVFGRMFGAGRIDEDRTRQRFVFRVTEQDHQEYGRLEFWSLNSRDDDDDDDACDGDRERDYGRNHRRVKTTFVSTSIASVVFSDNPAFTPGRSRRPPTVDSVVFAGAGKWKGKAGYTFEVSASDRGEPGRFRDSFALVIKDPGGIVVASVSGTIEGGNIQSTRLSR